MNSEENWKFLVLGVSLMPLSTITELQNLYCTSHLIPDSPLMKDIWFPQLLIIASEPLFRKLFK